MSRARLRYIVSCAWLMLVLIGGGHGASAQTGADDFASVYDQIFQIRVSSPVAGSKSSIGSGFQISSAGLIVTNYHVIADYVQSPDKHQIRYRSYTGDMGELELLNFDVIHDLALLRIDKPAAQFLRLSPLDTAVEKGDLVFALGNPRDFGVTLVQGFNNGFVEHSYNDQILFSGSLNPGMSGGPALNSAQEVIGVNVATAGSQLSFLVPVAKLHRLANDGRELLKENYQAEIADQVKSWQTPRLQNLIDNDWSIERFANRELFGEVRKDFQCWGDTNQDNRQRQIDWARKRCTAGNDVYLSARLNLGQILFSFSQRDSIKLNRFQFSQSLGPSMAADNRSNYENSSEFRCESDFLTSETDEIYTRVSTCIRHYKKLPDLYDSLLLIEDVSNQSMFTAHLSIAGAEQGQIMALNQKFIEQVR